MIRSALATAFLLLAVAQAGAAELTAVVLRIDHGRESVRLGGPGLRLDPRPVPFQTMAPGVIIHVPSGASVEVVCSTPSFVRIEGPASWRLDRQSCGRGKPISRADYALVAPRGGRFQYARGLWAFERTMRGERELDPLIPVILSPRDTLIRSPRPTLAWLRVPLASQYRIDWGSRGADAFSIQLGTDEVACSGRRDGLDVCELPWPSDRPDLPPGRTYFLRIAARRAVVDDWHAAKDPVEVSTMGADQAALVETRLAGLGRLGFGDAPWEVAVAGVLAEAGLKAEAIESVRKAIDLAPTAALRIALADLYLSTGLDQLARVLYSEDLEDADPAVRASAAFGMGRLESRQGRYHEASLRFLQARKLYPNRSFHEERAAARSEAKKAEAHHRRPS